MMKQRIKRWTAIGIAILAVACVACHSQPESVTDEIIRGNNVAEINGDVFFKFVKDPYDEFEMYRYQSKTKKTEQIEMLGSCCSDGTYLYYDKNNEKLCRLNKGKEEVLIKAEDKIQTFSLYQDYIIFMALNRDRGGIIYRANKDGSNCVELTGEHNGRMVSTMVVYQGFAYVCQADYEPTDIEDGFTHHNNGYKINIETGEWEAWQPFIEIIGIDEGWIYYRNDELFFSMVPEKEDHHMVSFSKIKADGSSDAKALQRPEGNDVRAVKDGWWYYIDQEGTLIRIREDGSDRQELYQQVNFVYGIMNGNLYFKTGENKDAGMNYNLCQMDLKTMKTIELI